MARTLHATERGTPEAGERAPEAGERAPEAGERAPEAGERAPEAGGAPRVSAVVVTYRSASHLEALLPTLAATVDELVVVDNASDDSSAEVAERLAPAADVVRCAGNLGFAAGVNTGVARTTGDLLLLCNPDVVLDPTAVKGLVEASVRYPGDVLGPVVRLPDGRLQPTRSGPPTLWNLLGEQLLVRDTATPGSWPARLWPRWRAYDREEPGPLLSGVCLLVPRALWERTGGFDERYFLYWEEIDWQLRAQAHGARSILVPSVEVVHERSGSTGRHDERRARLFAAASRLFVRRWLPGWRAGAALGVLATGQLVRAVAWSLPPARGRPEAAGRRGQHTAALRGLVGLGERRWRVAASRARVPRQPGRARVWLVEMFGLGGIARYTADVADLLGGEDAGDLDVVVATTASGPAPGLRAGHEVWFRTGAGPRAASNRRGPRGAIARTRAGLAALARLQLRVRGGDVAWVPLGVRPVYEAALTSSLRARGAVVVATLHNRAPHGRPGTSRLVLATARRAHLVVVHSEALEAWATSAGLPVERLAFPPPREDVAGPAGRYTRERLGASGGDVLVALAGNLYAYKGVDVLLDAAARLATRPGTGRLRFVLAGQEAPGADLAAEVARRGLGERVRTLVGYLDPGEFVDVLEACDAVALTYRRIDHSGVGALAAARGIPAVASDLPALRELFGDAALYAPAGDPDGLADALARLPSEIGRLREAAAGRAPSAGSATAYRSAVRRLVARRAARPAPGAPARP